MRLSPDGTTVALFEDPALLSNEVDPARLPIRLLDLATGQESATLDGFDDYAADVAFSPDGNQLASKHLNGQLLVWDLAGAHDAPVTSIRTMSLGGGRISFLPDGQTVAMLVAGIPSWIELIDLEAGRVTSVAGPAPDTYAEFIDQTRAGPPFDLQIVAMEVSPDGTMIATSTFNDEVALWSLESGEPRNAPAGVRATRWAQHPTAGVLVRIGVAHLVRRIGRPNLRVGCRQRHRDRLARAGRHALRVLTGRRAARLGRAP